MGLTLDQAYEENTLLKDMVVKHGLTGGYDTPQREQLGSGVKQPPRTAGSVPWSDFSVPGTPDSNVLLNFSCASWYNFTSSLSNIQLCFSHYFEIIPCCFYQFSNV